MGIGIDFKWAHVRRLKGSTAISYRRLGAILCVCVFAPILSVSCSTKGHDSYDSLAKTLDSLPLPDEFRFLNEQRYQFNDGPSDKANAVARRYDPGRLKDVFAAVRAAFIEGGIELPPLEKPDPHHEAPDLRVQTTIDDAAIVVFTDQRPVEVRAYD